MIQRYLFISFRSDPNQRLLLLVQTIEDLDGVQELQVVCLMRNSHYSAPKLGVAEGDRLDPWVDWKSPWF